MLSVWAIYEVTSFPWRVFLCFIWNPTTHTSVHSMVPKRSFLVTSGKFCYFLVELFHTERVWCLWGGQVVLLTPRLPVCFCKSGSGNTAGNSAPLGSSQKTGEKPRRWGDDTAVVSGSTALAAAEDTVTYWNRGWNVCLELREKTLWVWVFIQVM